MKERELEAIKHYLSKVYVALCYVGNVYIEHDHQQWLISWRRNQTLPILSIESNLFKSKSWNQTMLTFLCRGPCFSSPSSHYTEEARKSPRPSQHHHASGLHKVLAEQEWQLSGLEDLLVPRKEVQLLVRMPA
jgi:hypothetical protein